MKHLRTIAWLLLCVFLAASLSGCSKPDKTAYDHGLELVQTMAELANSEAYLALTTGSATVTEKLLPVQEGEVGEPTAVYTVTLGEDYLSSMAEWNEIS